MLRERSHFRSTCVAQKRLCLNSLNCVVGRLGRKKKRARFLFFRVASAEEREVNAKIVCVAGVRKGRGRELGRRLTRKWFMFSKPQDPLPSEQWFLQWFLQAGRYNTATNHNYQLPWFQDSTRQTRHAYVIGQYAPSHACLHGFFCLAKKPCNFLSFD